MKLTAQGKARFLPLALLLILPTACASAQKREGAEPAKGGENEASRAARVRPPAAPKCPDGTHLTFWEGPVDSFERARGRTKITVTHEDSGVTYTG